MFDVQHALTVGKLLSDLQAAYLYFAEAQVGSQAEIALRQALQEQRAAWNTILQNTLVKIQHTEPTNGEWDALEEIIALNPDTLACQVPQAVAYDVWLSFLQRI